MTEGIREQEEPLLLKDAMSTKSKKQAKLSVADTLRHVFVLTFLISNALGNYLLNAKHSLTTEYGQYFYYANLGMSLLGVVAVLRKYPQVIRLTAAYFTLSFMANAYAAWKAINFFVDPQVCSRVNLVIVGEQAKFFCYDHRRVFQGMVVGFILAELAMEVLFLAQLGAIYRRCYEKKPRRRGADKILS